MGKFRITYQIEFVSGNLVGIKTYCTIDYPMASFDRVIDEFRSDVETGRIINGFGSGSYKILDFGTERIA